MERMVPKNILSQAHNIKYSEAFQIFSNPFDLIWF